MAFAFLAFAAALSAQEAQPSGSPENAASEPVGLAVTAASGLFLDPGASILCYLNASLEYSPLDGLAFGAELSAGIEPPSTSIPTSGAFSFAAEASWSPSWTPWLAISARWTHHDRPAWTASQNCVRASLEASIPPGWRASLGYAFVATRVGAEYEAGSLSFAGDASRSLLAWSIMAPLASFYGHELRLSLGDYDAFLCEEELTFILGLHWRYDPESASTGASGSTPATGRLVWFADASATLRGLSGLALSLGGFRIEGGASYAW